MLAHVFLNHYSAIAFAKFISLRQRRTGLAEQDEASGSYPDEIGMQVQKKVKCKFRDSSMVDPDKVGMLTGGFRNKKMKIPR